MGAKGPKIGRNERKIAGLLAIILICGPPARAQEVARTPPMGWNSYNCYGSTVHEDEIKANAVYMGCGISGNGPMKAGLKMGIRYGSRRMGPCS